MADPRKAHVKRVHKIVVDPDGNEVIVDDYWVDVLRLDKVPFRFQSAVEGFQGQIITQVINWNDDPYNPLPNADTSNADVQFENANAERKTRKLTIQDPDVKSDTATKGTIDDDSIYLWIVDKLKSVVRGPSVPVGQAIIYSFDSWPADGSGDKQPGKDRKTSPIKVAFNDLGGLL